ncbi:MAG: hypothetical protein ABSG43_28725 [Solirubrobacteraceae bacterium]|jgi:hypothetical protein
MPDRPAFIVAVIVVSLLVVVAVRVWRANGTRGARRVEGSALGLASAARVAAIRRQVSAGGGGAFLGATGRGGWRLARPQRAVLVLGPPRSREVRGVDHPHRPVLPRAGGLDLDPARRAGCDDRRPSAGGAGVGV